MAMFRLVLLFGSVVALMCGAAVIYFTSGQAVPAFLLVLSAAVLLVGACLYHAIDELRQDLISVRGSRNV
jgi:hypothetical protein